LICLFFWGLRIFYHSADLDDSDSGRDGRFGRLKLNFSH
jgi:hypothetical protein